MSEFTGLITNFLVNGKFSTITLSYSLSNINALDDLNKKVRINPVERMVIDLRDPDNYPAKDDGKWGWSQGCGAGGGYVYNIIKGYTDSSASTGYCKILKIDPSDWSIVKRSGDLEIGHGASLTYNSNYPNSPILITRGDGADTDNLFWLNTNMEIKSTTTTPTCSGLHWSGSGFYLIPRSGSLDFAFYEPSSSPPAPPPGNYNLTNVEPTDIGATPAAADCIGDLCVFCRSIVPKNLIGTGLDFTNVFLEVFKKSGTSATLIRRLPLPSLPSDHYDTVETVEPEAIFFLNNKLYYTASDWYYCYIYELEIWTAD